MKIKISASILLWLLIFINLALQTRCERRYETLRKLSIEKDYQQLINQINNSSLKGLPELEIPVKDSLGNIISKYSIAKIDFEKYAFENYVDKDNHVKLQVIRHITERDRLLKEEMG